MHPTTITTANMHEKLLLAATLVQGYPAPLNDITDIRSPTTFPALPYKPKNTSRHAGDKNLITALRAYSHRGYEQDIDTAWDHRLAAVRQTSSPEPTPRAAQTESTNVPPTPDEPATTQ